MDRPLKEKTRKVSCNKTKPKDDTVLIAQPNSESCSTSTPIRTSIVDSENDDSPALSGFTQECDEMAVMWNWNSPQTRQKIKRKPRKLCNESPKRTFKRHPSNNNQELMFEKLKEEFQALREQIAIPDNEDCLVLSPLEEEEYKNDTKNHSAIDSLIQDDNQNAAQDFEDIFNDSLDQELFMCTQKVENDVISKHEIDEQLSPRFQGLNSDIKRDKTHRLQNSCKPSDHAINNNCTKSKVEICSKIDDKFDDSLNMVFEAFQDKDIELLTQNCTKKKVINPEGESTSSMMKRTYSDMQVQVNRSKVLLAENGKTDFLRTHSFESIGTQKDHLPPYKVQEIERKRQEALAKLKAKQNTQKTKAANISPTHCSPVEIEQKRLQAIAKLEAKKKQDLEIQRKRQEALKRLEQNKMRRTLVGNNTKRL